MQMESLRDKRTKSYFAEKSRESRKRRRDMELSLIRRNQFIEEERFYLRAKVNNLREEYEMIKQLQGDFEYQEHTLWLENMSLKNQISKHRIFTEALKVQSEKHFSLIDALDSAHLIYKNIGFLLDKLMVLKSLLVAQPKLPFDCVTYENMRKQMLQKFDKLDFKQSSADFNLLESNPEVRIFYTPRGGKYLRVDCYDLPISHAQLGQFYEKQDEYHRSMHRILSPVGNGRSDHRIIRTAAGNDSSLARYKPHYTTLEGRFPNQSQTKSVFFTLSDKNGNKAQQHVTIKCSLPHDRTDLAVLDEENGTTISGTVCEQGSSESKCNLTLIFGSDEINGPISERFQAAGDLAFSAEHILLRVESILKFAYFVSTTPHLEDVI